MQNIAPIIRCSAACAAIFLCLTAAAGEKTSARARKTHRLGELALDITLKRDAATSVDGVLTISNETVAASSGGGRLTTAPRAAAELPAQETPSAKELAAARKNRERWQHKVAAQRRRVAKAKADLAALDAKIDALVNQAFDAGAKGTRLWARVEEARSRRPAAAEKLRDEELQLARIIREARRDGAQPGWFR